MDYIDSVNQFLKNNYKTSFPTSNQSVPFVLHYEKYNNDSFEYSIVIPIHNQEQIIIETLESVIINTTSNFELIIILDNCVDNTEQIVLEYFKTLSTSNLTSILVIKQETPIFETSCDNIGFKLSKGKFIIEIQADIHIKDKGYEKFLSRPLKHMNNVIGVSGRCAHGFFNNKGFGKLGDLLEKSLEDIDKSLSKDYFYVYETCNRGPLLFDNEKLKEMNYLDEENFFLDSSEHDLFARAYFEKNYICGYVPIEFNCKLENGSTRKERDQINQKAYEERLLRRKGGYLSRLYRVYKPREKTKHYIGHLDL